MQEKALRAWQIERVGPVGRVAVRSRAITRVSLKGLSLLILSVNVVHQLLSSSLVES